MQPLSLSLLALGAAVGLAAGASAQGLAAVGPVETNHGFPAWYEDDLGRRLDLCLSNRGLCLLDGLVELTNPGLAFPANYGGTFPQEAFWWACEASMPTNGGGQALLVLALEAAFANGPVAAGDQVAFARVRIRVDNLVAGRSYNVVTPVGNFTFVATNPGQRGINFTSDVGLVPGVFTGALNGAIGPFLRWNSDLPLVDVDGRQYVGNPAVPHRITGSPFGTNFFRVTGPAVGGPGVNSVQTDVFALMGMESVAAPPPVPVASFTSAPNAGAAPLAVAFTDTSTGEVSSRLWSFGDGVTSTLANPTHTYAQGTYTVSLTVTGPGGTDTETRANLIAVGPPQANELVLANPVPGTAGSANTFVVTGATPNATVGIYSGLVPGSTIRNLGNCGGIAIGLANPFRLLGSSRANAAGIATIVAGAPATSAGRLFFFQAVEPASCRTSTVVSDRL